MKILLVGRCVTSLPPRNGGGAEWHGYHMAKALDKLGHEVHYVTNCKEPLELNGVIAYNICKTLSPVEVSRFPFMAFNKWILKHFKENVYAARKAMSVLAQEKDFDVIHCHGNLAAYILSKVQKRVPVVYTEHDASPWTCEYRTVYERFIRKFFYYLLNKKAIEQVSHVITVSNSQKEFFVEKWHLPSEKITVIQNGVDNNSFQPGKNGNISRKYSLPGDYSLFVGRLEPRKGVDFLIRSLKLANISSVIVGDGPDRKKLEQLSHNLGVSKKVIFTGSVSENDLQHLYSGAKFFVLPSVSEVGPTLTILEAMSSGIPVVASNISGVSEIVKHNYNGLLFSPNNVNSLGNAQQILINNSLFCRSMGMRARKTVEKNYSWEKVAERVVEVYEKHSDKK